MPSGVLELIAGLFGHSSWNLLSPCHGLSEPAACVCAEAALHEAEVAEIIPERAISVPFCLRPDFAAPGVSACGFHCVESDAQSVICKIGKVS
jgi:hypothetical protein